MSPVPVGARVSDAVVNPVAPGGSPQPAASSRPGRGSGQEQHRALGYLRAFLTVLVVAHHAVLAYNVFAPEQTASLATEPRWWKAFPVVDAERSVAWTLFNAFNDGFFMPLMFFLSGLFVWGSLRRKGAAMFARDRALRLGLPFVLAAAVVAPIAYYPSYLTRSAAPSVTEYARLWLSLGDWPAGPAWFVWLLLAFDVAVVALLRLLPVVADRPSQPAGWLFRRPVAFFAALVGVSAAVYVPLALAFGPIEWATLGPFTFQTSRLLLYALYFAAGVAVGRHGIERGLLASGGALASRWPIWAVAALPAFGLLIAVVLVASAAEGTGVWMVIGGGAFALSCAASGFAFLAIFLQFANARRRAWDSLRDNAYGVYLIHYAFASWLQYALLTAPLTALVKGTLVFLGTLALSWGTAALLRRVPAVARVI